jgi:hypothetical protein
VKTSVRGGPRGEDCSCVSCSLCAFGGDTLCVRVCVRMCGGVPLYVLCAVPCAMSCGRLATVCLCKSLPKSVSCVECVDRVGGSGGSCSARVRGVVCVIRVCDV